MQYFTSWCLQGNQIQTLGTRKCFVFNPTTGEEGIIQFRIVNEDLTPLIGLSDSEELKLIELLRKNIAALDSEGYRMVYRKRCVSENISPLSKSRHSKQESRNLGVATR